MKEKVVQNSDPNAVTFLSEVSWRGGTWGVYFWPKARYGYLMFIPRTAMSLSSRLQAKVNANRAEREALLPQERSLLDRCFVAGLALGVGGGVLAISFGMRNPSVAPVAAPVAPVVTPVAAPTAPAKESQVCNPYASNGTYLPELCGDNDAFQGRLDRSFSNDAEKVKAQSLSYASEKMLERCDRDWLPSTCAKLRAELAAK